MCGICGIVYKDRDRSVDPALLKKMSDTLIHRGPDDVGFYRRGNVGLGHRRLAVIDLERGHQPLSDAAGKLWIVHNGEIYNHAAIRRSLESKGYQYRTHSDAETIVNCYSEYGSAGLHHLRGMFAFAVHDQRDNSLFVARDRLGIKPLYYLDTEELFAFASEIKALLVIPEYTVAVDSDALLQILALKYTADDTTLFRNIRKLEPAHYLELRNGVVSISPYWDCGTVAIDHTLDESEAVEEMRRLLDESVQLRLMSDVPVGVFLSGGIDSTIIACRMAKLSCQQITTFSVGFNEPEANELQYARLAASYAEIDHYEVLMSAPEFFRLLPRLIYHEDEPIAYPSSVALYRLAELAREYVTVVLTGEGADELFGGYERYYQTLYNLKAARILSLPLLERTRRHVVRPLLEMLSQKLPYCSKAVRTSLYLDGDLTSLYLDNYATFSRARLARLLRDETLRQRATECVYDAVTRYLYDSDGNSLLSRLLYADVKTYLVELLMKQDQMSMAASIESRVPFLDHRLVEFAFKVPDHLKVRGFTTKRLLRLAFGDEIPREILRRPKAGFPVPIGKWLAAGSSAGANYNDLARAIILGDDSFCRQMFDEGEIELYLTRHWHGKGNYADQIWTLLNLELWHSIYVKQQKPLGLRLVAA